MAVELPIGADYESADIVDLQETVYLRGDDLDRLRRQKGLKDLGYAYEDYSDLRKSALVKKLREMDTEINRLNGNEPEPQPIPTPAPEPPAPQRIQQPTEPVSPHVTPQPPVMPTPQPTPPGDSSQAEIDSLHNQLSTKDAELSQAKDRCAQLEKQVRELQNKLQEAPDTEDFRKLQREIRTLKTENEELSNDLSAKERALTRERNRSSQIEEELNNLQARTNRLPSSAAYEELQHDFNRLQERLKAEEQKSSRLEAELEEQKRISDNLKSKLTEVKDVPSGLKGAKKNESHTDSYRTSMPTPANTPQSTHKSAVATKQVHSGAGMLGEAFQ